MRSTIVTTILAAALAVAPLSAAFAQASPTSRGPAAIGGQSGGSGGPMVGDTGPNTGTDLARDTRTAPRMGAGSTGTDASIGGIGSGANGGGTGGPSGASGGGGASR